MGSGRRRADMSKHVRALCLVLSLCLLVTLLTGCVGWVTRHATFVRYDMRDGQKTGWAWVKLSSGKEEVAECPFPDLKEGDKVTVRVTHSQSWVVLSVDK